GTIACAAASAPGETAHLNVPLLRPGRYVLGIDGAGSTSGTFALQATLGPPPQTYSPVPGEACSTAITLHLDRGPVTVTGDTTNAFPDGPHWSCTQGQGQDQVYELYAYKTGKLSATVTPTGGWDAAIGLSNTLCYDLLQIECSDEF